MATRRKKSTPKNKYNKYRIISLVFFILCFVLLVMLFHKSSQWSKGISQVTLIQIQGVNSRLKYEIRKALETIKGKDLKNINIQEIKKKLLGLPMISNVSVTIIKPNTIMVRAVEKNPLFIWQTSEDHFLLVNNEDEVVGRARLQDYKNLILVKGGDLPISLSDEVRYYVYGMPELKDIVSSIEYNGRSWDLVLKNGILIKLPEENIKQALKFILLIDSKYQLLKREIEYIDAKVHGKLFVMPKRGFVELNR